MLKFNVFLFLITLCVVESKTTFKTMCENDFRDKKNNSIDVLQYCSDKLCIQKCCGPNKIMVFGKRCVHVSIILRKNKIFPNFASQYNSTNILSIFNLNETEKDRVVFLQNQRNSKYLHNCTAAHADTETYVISKDGSLQFQETNGLKGTVEKLQYCIDKNIVAKEDGPQVTTVVLQVIEDPDKMNLIAILENIGVSISSFFLLLVLIVYCLLPNLRNLTGLVLMAYTLTLLVAFITKLIMHYYLVQPILPDNFCKIISPILYFAFVSSIFWMSVYAFDVWWGLRGFRTNRNSTHDKIVKFLWYALFAWGTPLLLTAIITVLDNLSDLKLAVPTPFTTCFLSGVSLDFYYKIPIGILLFMNIVLFCMTIYNIWMVKRAFNKCHDSRKTMQQNSKFATYAKLFSMMGVSWCMELVPSEDEPWLYILINVYNLLTGFIIFYMFVCKKIILVQLCKKFNIQNKYIKYIEMRLIRNRTQSGITRSTAGTTVKRNSKDTSQDTNLLQNSSKEETTII